jgi:hypothetical protein
VAAPASSARISSAGNQRWSNFDERVLNSAVHHPQLVGQNGLVLGPQIPRLPPVQATGVAVVQGGVDQRGDQLLERLGAVGAVEELLTQAQHRAAKEVVLAGVVAVQRGRRDPDLGGDGLHADRVVALSAECLGRRPRDLRLAVFRSPPDTRCGFAGRAGGGAGGGHRFTLTPDRAGQTLCALPQLQNVH